MTETYIESLLKQQAQLWAEEAKAQRASLLEIYQALGIQKGDWNGARPVLDFIAALEAESKTREVSESEIAAYTLQAFGERHHAINGHREDLNICSYPTCVNLAESITALRHTATTPDKESRGWWPAGQTAGEPVDAETLTFDAAEADANNA